MPPALYSQCIGGSIALIAKFAPTYRYQPFHAPTEYRLLSTILHSYLTCNRFSLLSDICIHTHYVDRLAISAAAPTTPYRLAYQGGT